MPAHNNMIIKNHFHKQWDWRLKTWFNQPMRKLRRRKNRLQKARKVFPRPVSGPLRPLVRCPSQKYNMKVREGRGFSLEELKQAEVSKHVARGLGISVDYRRINHSLEDLTVNVQRLKAYKSKLIVFPRKAGKPKKGEATKEEISKVVQHKHSAPIHVFDRRDKARAITEKEKKHSVFKTQRREWKKQRHVGDAVRKAKRAALQVGGDAKGKGGAKKKEGGDEE